MRFPRCNRLLTKADYKVVFDKSSKVNQKHFLALYKPNQKSYARLGLVIGKRFVNSAVKRNRIKRISRESFRFHHEQLIGFDIIIIARFQSDTLDKSKIREGIDRLWEKLPKQSQNLSP